MWSRMWFRASTKCKQISSKAKTWQGKRGVWAAEYGVRSADYGLRYTGESAECGVRIWCLQPTAPTSYPGYYLRLWTGNGVRIMDYGVRKECNAKYEVRIMDCGVRGAESMDVKYGVRIMDCGRSMCVRNKHSHHSIIHKFHNTGILRTSNEWTKSLIDTIYYIHIGLIRKPCTVNFGALANVLSPFKV